MLDSGLKPGIALRGCRKRLIEAEKCLCCREPDDPRNCSSRVSGHARTPGAYPSSIFQAEILRDRGCEVAIWDCEDGGYQAAMLPDGVERKILGRTHYTWQNHSPWLAPLRRIAFRMRVRRGISRSNPHVVIACEPPAMAALSSLAMGAGARRRMIWHFHEYPDLNPSFGPGTRRDLEFARNHAGRPDIVVFPDKHRGERFLAEVGLRRDIAVVMNCPRRLANLPEPTLREALRYAGKEAAQMVLYNGSVGPGHGLELAVRSIPFWPSGSLLVLIGPCSASYRQALEADARSLGVRERLVFLGVVDPRRIWGIRTGADLALTIMEPVGANTTNYRFAAGASNKRFEAMAAGVAQITNEGPGIEAIIDEVGCGLSVPTENPHELGEAVRYLLTDNEKRKEMGENGRAAHLDRFNYEVQFQPLLEKVLSSTCVVLPE